MEAETRQQKQHRKNSCTTCKPMLQTPFQKDIHDRGLALQAFSGCPCHARLINASSSTVDLCQASPSNCKCREPRACRRLIACTNQRSACSAIFYELHLVATGLPALCVGKSCSHQSGGISLLVHKQSLVHERFLTCPRGPNEARDEGREDSATGSNGRLIMALCRTFGTLASACPKC